MEEGYVLALPVIDQFSRIRRKDVNFIQPFTRTTTINRQEEIVLGLPVTQQVKIPKDLELKEDLEYVVASEAEADFVGSISKEYSRKASNIDDDICVEVGDSDPIVVQDHNSNENHSRNNDNDNYLDDDDHDDLFVSGNDYDEVNFGEITSEGSAQSCTESGFCTAYPSPTRTRDSTEHSGSDSAESRKIGLRGRVRKRSEEDSSNEQIVSNEHDDGICTDDEEEERPVKRRALPSRGAGKTLSPRSALLVAAAAMKKQGSNDNKKRHDGLHKLLFLPNGLPDGTYLAYKVRGQTVLEGCKKANGIFCNHCSTVISPSQFEAHAGMAARKKPYHHIYTADGIALHDIAVTLAEGPQQQQTPPMNDVDITMCSSDCVRKRRPRMKKSVRTSTRAEKKSEIEYVGSCCVLCSGHDFSVNKFDDRTVIICDQCEKEFHVGCLREDGRCDLKGLPVDKWFCCCDCDRIYTSLRNLVSGRSAEVIPLSESRKINGKLKEGGLRQVGDNDIRVRLLQGKRCHPEHRPLLSKAICLFREGFGSITAANGRDLIPPMVHGKNFFGQEFGGMYCAVLTVRSVVVSVALVRILGREVAEVPLAATRMQFRGKGLFNALFWQIEKLIGQLKVEKLVLPATQDAKQMWIDKFGFSEISQEKLSTYTEAFPLSVFDGTVMLDKQVVQ